ncbi:hypothetical protein AAFF_G00385600 [Aldrovandia affinis]|uniref:Uncharacterized protein n=1 Tax=Aldrovandia affinis TaxID=143900 RepID=A0AAD7SF72_9TELE|nr:hypothetical protein AAFF_G00385600 [Aldrovandia affinis]
MTCHVHMLLRARDTAFRSRDGALYRAARAELKGGIKNTKADYKKRIEDHLSSNNPRQVWQGIQNITNYRGCVVTTGNPGEISGMLLGDAICLPTISHDTLPRPNYCATDELQQGTLLYQRPH